MDQYVKITKQKNISTIGRNSIIKTISELLSNNEVICVYGDVGVGKTYVVKATLSNFKFYDLSDEYNVDLELLKDSTSHVLIDDIDISFWKQKINNGSLTKGGTIFVTNSIKNIDFCNLVKIEPLSIIDQVTIARNKFPNKSLDDINYAISISRGNLRDLFDYLNGSDLKDLFLTPKDLIHSFLCSSDFNANQHIGDVIQDHGFSSAIVQENYIYSKNINTNYISEQFSMADIYDSKIYAGNWDLLPYFCHHGIIAPCIAINQQLNKEIIKPGSTWTKYNNFKMRESKLKNIKHRTGLGVDELLTIKNKCILNPKEAIELMKSYHLQSSDLDTINHLAVTTHIKPKDLKYLKKHVSEK